MWLHAQTVLPSPHRFNLQPKEADFVTTFFGGGIALKWEWSAGGRPLPTLATGGQEIVTDEKNKPVLDERTFDKLLRAAYVLQEHNRKMREMEEETESESEGLREQDQEQESLKQAPLPASKPESEESSRSDGDYTLTLAEIVEAQRQIQVRHLELDKALALIAEKVARIANATGAAIGILKEKMVCYRAGAGAPALPAGSEVPIAKAICAASVRTGQVIRSDDVNTEVLFDPEPCRQRGILSLLAVPIYYDDDIVGALELYFDRIHGYAEQDIHTCQLMAGLVTEAIGRDAELKLKKSMAADRSTMLAAIEKLQPNLAALAQSHSAERARTEMSASTVAAPKSLCWKCGSRLVGEEQFCGKCGAPRVTDNDESPGMQSKLSSAWHMQNTRRESLADEPLSEELPAQETALPVAAYTSSDSEDDLHLDEDEGSARLPEPFSLPELEENEPRFAAPFRANADEDATAESVQPESQLNQDKDNADAPSTAITKPQQEDEEIVWSSAAKAREFLESLSGTDSPSALTRFWRSRRGDFYLAVAVVLIVVVIRWGIWSNHSVGATGSGTAVSGSATRRKQAAPDADLSLFDKLLIGLGMAEAPEAPEYKGNPDVQVWVDLHTALYYCPGSDLYNKTSKGKLESQREAQLDQFEPAYRKPCD
jgi:GAF domain-containing protein